VVNEGENGMWLEFCELKELPEVGTDDLTANTTFQCAGNDHLLIFSFRNGGVGLIYQIVSAG
jgi:hypothetical protein